MANDVTNKDWLQSLNNNHHKPTKQKRSKSVQAKKLKKKNCMNWNEIYLLIHTWKFGSKKCLVTVAINHGLDGGEHGEGREWHSKSNASNIFI